MKDLLRIEIEGGKYTLVQKGTGEVVILRYGEEWIVNPPGVKCILAMGYELEELRLRTENDWK